MSAIRLHTMKGSGDMAKKAKYEVYRDVSGEWRGRLRAANGRIVLDSGEGYKRKVDVKAVARNYINDKVEVVEV